MIVTRPEYADYIEKALSRKIAMSLSKGTMETLVVAHGSLLPGRISRL